MMRMTHLVEISGKIILGIGNSKHRDLRGEQAERELVLLAQGKGGGTVGRGHSAYMQGSQLPSPLLL